MGIMKRLYLILFASLLSVSALTAQDMPKWIGDYFEATENNDFSKAEEIFNSNFDRNNSDCCFINGYRQAEKGNIDWAIGWFEAAIARYTPANYYERALIYLTLAEIYNNLERYEEALDCIIKAKDDNFANGKGGAEDIIRIAQQHTKMGQYDKAENIYYHILNYEENNEDAKIDLAYLYLMYAAPEDSVLLDSLALSLIDDVITIRPQVQRLIMQEHNIIFIKNKIIRRQ